MEILSSLMNGEYKGRKRLFEFSLDVFTEFMEFIDNILKIFIIKITIRTCCLLC